MAEPGTILKLLEVTSTTEEITSEQVQELARLVGISSYALEAKLRQLGRMVPTECTHKPGFVSYGRIELPDGLLQGSGLRAPATKRRDGWYAGTLGENRVQREVAPDGSSKAHVDEADRKDGEEAADPRINRVRFY